MRKRDGDLSANSVDRVNLIPHRTSLGRGTSTKNAPSSRWRRGFLASRHRFGLSVPPRTVTTMTTTRIHALPIYADSVVAPRVSNIEPDFRLYQRIVGGHFEAVYGETADEQRVVFYVNEDGRMLGLPVNVVATQLWHRLNPTASQFLVGNAVVVGVDGCDDGDLPPAVAGIAHAVHHEIEVAGFVARFRAVP